LPRASLAGVCVLRLRDHRAAPLDLDERQDHQNALIVPRQDSYVADGSSQNCPSGACRWCTSEESPYGMAEPEFPQALTAESNWGQRSLAATPMTSPESAWAFALDKFVFCARVSSISSASVATVLPFVMSAQKMLPIFPTVTRLSWI